MTSFAKTARDEEEYPSSDGKPMAETGIHFDNMINTIGSLREHYQDAADVYVAGNMLMYYVRGDKHQHVSPDIFVVLNSNKKTRKSYLVWEEGRAPDFVIELTSSSTRSEDLNTKFELYRDVLKIKEYFLFDPQGEFLKPSLQGYRLVRGRYAKIRPVRGRLGSKVLNLELEQDGCDLRLFDPVAGKWLPNAHEESLARREAELARQEAELARQEAELARQEAELARQKAEDELQALRKKLERGND